MSTIIQFIAIFSLANLLMGCDKDTSTVKTSDQSINESTNSGSDGKCTSGWSSFATGSMNLTEKGFYCQKDGTTYKCNNNVSNNNGIIVTSCPSDFQTRILRENAIPDWQKKLNEQMHNLDEHMKKINEQIKQKMKKLQKEIIDCPSWQPYGSNNMTKTGLYCGKDGHNYKCSSIPARMSGISYGSCPQNMKTARKLQLQDESVDSSDDWKQFDQEMKQLQAEIDHCSSWEKYNSNSMTKTGLYCGKDGQNYNCSSTPAGMSGISYGTCPQNMKTARKLQLQDKIDHCSSWAVYGPESKIIAENGVYCQQDGQTYKCSSAPSGISINVDSCPSDFAAKRTQSLVV